MLNCELLKKNMKYTRKKKKHLFCFATSIVLSLSIVFALIFYIIQTNDLASKNYQLKISKHKIEKIKNENQEVYTNLAQTRSFKNLENFLFQNNMIEISEPGYLTLYKSELAIR